jgi:hypothetical protein
MRIVSERIFIGLTPGESLSPVAKAGQNAQLTPYHSIASMPTSLAATVAHSIGDYIRLQQLGFCQQQCQFGADFSHCVIAVMYAPQE